MLRPHEVSGHPGEGTGQLCGAALQPGNVILAQDSVPAHTAQQVQDLLKRKIPKFMPKEKRFSSPDLNFGAAHGPQLSSAQLREHIKTIEKSEKTSFKRYRRK